MYLLHTLFLFKYNLNAERGYSLTRWHKYLLATNILLNVLMF